MIFLIFWVTIFHSLTQRAVCRPNMGFLSKLERCQERVGAVVLAGGLARRMGGKDKGLIQLGDQPMASWAINTVKPQVHKVVINANRNHDDYAALGCPVVADRHSGHIGPLAGLSAAMHHLDTDYVFMCPCDSPFVSASIVSLLGEPCIDQAHDVAVAHDGERLQPVFCVVNQRCLASLDEYLESGERKIDRWYATQNTVEVNCQSIIQSFRNINTEEERLAAQHELLT